MLSVWTRRRKRRPTSPAPETRPKVMLRVRPNDGQVLDCDARIQAAAWEQFLAGITNQPT